jgi:hypothetical protein
VKYGRTPNNVDGAGTCWSPYISQTMVATGDGLGVPIAIKNPKPSRKNINKYTNPIQVNPSLDKPFEALEIMVLPMPLSDTQRFSLAWAPPETSGINFTSGLSTFTDNYYNVDPLWHKDDPGNRVLWIGPDFFTKYPVGKKCIGFMLALSKTYLMFRFIQIRLNGFLII